MPHFVQNQYRGFGLRTTICPRTVVGGKEGHVHCKVLSLQQDIFFVSAEIHGVYRTVLWMLQTWLLSVVGDIT